MNLPSEKQLRQLRVEHDPGGTCMEAADELLHLFEAAKLLYVEKPDQEPFTPSVFTSSGVWKYHSAVIIDGRVYDPWLPHAAYPIENYLPIMFGRDTEIVVTIDAVDVYRGRADEFSTACS